MAKLLPFRRSDTAVEPREPRLVELDDDTADDVFAALSAGTARDILTRLYREPGTATDVAEAADTSLQNARYHLEKLQAAGLVEAVDTWYSSRGTEMTVYAPTNEPLVVAAGPEDQTSVLRSALARLIGALGVLGLSSLLVDRVARLGLPGLLPFGRTGGGDSGDAELAAENASSTQFQSAGNAATETATPNPTPAADQTQTVTEQATGTPMASPTPQETTVPVDATPSASPSPTSEPTTIATDPGLFDLAGGLPPGGLFFLGGIVVLGAVAAWWYWRRYRPLYG